MAEGTVNITVDEIRAPGRRKLYARVFPAGRERAARETRPVKASGPAAAVGETLSFQTTDADEELVIQVYESVFGPDVLVGAARMSLWGAITEGPQALAARLAPPRGGGPTAGEVAVRVAFQLATRRQQQALMQAAGAGAQAQRPQPYQQQPYAQAYQQPQQPQPAGGLPGWDAPPSFAAPQPAMGYPAIGAMGAPAAAAFNPWGAPASAAPGGGFGQPGAQAAAPYTSPYPQDPLAAKYAGPGAAATPQPAGKQQPQQQWQQQPPQWQQPPPQWQQPPPAPYAFPQQPGAPQQLPPRAQQLPMMPVVPAGAGGPNVMGGGGGGSKPGGSSGVGLGTAILGGLAAGLALDALF